MGCPCGRARATPRRSPSSRASWSPTRRRCARARSTCERRVRIRVKTVKNAGCYQVPSPAVCFLKPVRSLSFHPKLVTVQSLGMPTPPLQGSQEVESARLVLCGRNDCRRQFSVCGLCDHGRRYCGGGCAGAARRASLRRAGRTYQRTERGRRLHAERQARYRARLVRVTHQSQPNPREAAKITAPPVGSERPPAPVAAAPGPNQGADVCPPGTASACLVCAQRHVYHRVGFRVRRRGRARARGEVRPNAARRTAWNGPTRASNAP
jgi:hypothetical protein